jgi:hypothetical protein
LDDAYPGDQDMSFETNVIDAPRIHYERVVYDTLRILWKHRLLLAGVLAIALAALSVGLMLIAPRYTGEAMVQLDFIRNETVAGERVQSTGSTRIRPIRISRFRRARCRCFGSFSGCTRRRRVISPWHG